MANHRMKVVYIAHPLGSGEEREANRICAVRWVVWATEQGVAPVADWIILSGQWPESPENRARGLRIDVALVSRCDQLWLCGSRISPGMGQEVIAAVRAKVLVLNMLTIDGEPPRFGGVL